MVQSLWEASSHSPNQKIPGPLGDSTLLGTEKEKTATPSVGEFFTVTNAVTLL